ncbi:MAG: hypothetical protein OHK0022_38220 [Roseiflexaceae bacterium]
MVDNFNERLRREWSIETGIIERIYTIDRGTTVSVEEEKETDVRPFRETHSLSTEGFIIPARLYVSSLPDFCTVAKRKDAKGQGRKESYVPLSI